MPKGIPNKRYTPEFKEQVIKTMLEEKLSYSETCRKFEANSRDQIKSVLPCVHYIIVYHFFNRKARPPKILCKR